jgi:hypothetical protein
LSSLTPANLSSQREFKFAHATRASRFFGLISAAEIAVPILRTSLLSLASCRPSSRCILTIRISCVASTQAALASPFSFDRLCIMLASVLGANPRVWWVLLRFPPFPTRFRLIYSAREDQITFGIPPFTNIKRRQRCSAPAYIRATREF